MFILKKHKISFPLNTILSSLNIFSFIKFFSTVKSHLPMPQFPSLAIYYTTAPSFQQAQNLSSILLSQKLIACCNIIKDIKSVYFWQGKINNDSEVLMIMKSRLQLLDQIVEIVQKNHSYDTPEVIAMPIIGVAGKYMKWVLESTKGK